MERSSSHKLVHSTLACRRDSSASRAVATGCDGIVVGSSCCRSKQLDRRSRQEQERHKLERLERHRSEQQEHKLERQERHRSEQQEHKLARRSLAWLRNSYRSDGTGQLERCSCWYKQPARRKSKQTSLHSPSTSWPREREELVRSHSKHHVWRTPQFKGANSRHATVFGR